MCVYVHVRVCSVCVCVFLCVRACPRKPDLRGLQIPGVRITVSCEPPNVNAGNQTQVLCKECTLFTIQPSPQSPVCVCLPACVSAPALELGVRLCFYR